MTQKVALVTGASSGIGRNVAERFLSEGYAVILAARRLDKLKAIVERSNASESQAIAVATDVSKPEDVAHLFQCIRERFGRLDLLFNNAGVSLPSAELEDYSYDDWRKVLDVNVTGSFLCTQHAFRIMKDQRPMGGRIINNGSLSAQRPRALSAAYTTSKHAINGLTKSTALDGRKYNIACGQIDIGNAETTMAQKMHAGVPQADGSLAVEPTMPVQHVTDAIMYLASLPLSTNIPFMSVMATQMPFIGRG